MLDRRMPCGEEANLAKYLAAVSQEPELDKIEASGPRLFADHGPVAWALFANVPGEVGKKGEGKAMHRPFLPQA